MSQMYSQADMLKAISMVSKQYTAMKSGKDPRQMPTYKQDYKSDYTDDMMTWYNATDDITKTSGSGQYYSTQNLYELEFLANKRLGVGHAITEGFAKDALYNWFEPKKVDSENTRVKIPGFKKWQKDTDFKNKSILWYTHKRTYGIGLMVKFWTSHDKMETPAPRKPPKDFQVISPTLLSATNTYKTRYLTYDEEMWKFQGGNLKVRSIHPSRIEVIRGTPQTDNFRGYSVLEPIYLSLICYFNGMINITRGVAKWGSMIPVLKSGTVTPTPTEYTNFLKLMEEFVMNNFMFIGRDDKIEFPTVSNGQGILQAMEFIKEDIASGTRIPLNVLFGRAESGGIGGEGALTAERTYLNQLANGQTNISDDFINIFSDAGFDFEDRDLDWNLAIQKTKEQQLTEERMRLEIDMMRAQNTAMQLENRMMKQQEELYEKYKDQWTPEQQMEGAKQIEEDFVSQRMRFEDFQKIQEYFRRRTK